MIINHIKEAINQKGNKENNEKIISSKENIITHLLISNQLMNFQSDPLNNILNHYEQIEYFLKFNNINIFNYFYSSRTKIHKILYDEEQLINIQFVDEISTKLAYHFYLNLLICEDSNITNYSYSFKFITQINNLQKDINGKYTKIFLAKIIIDLIKNYEQLDEYNEENEEEIIEKIKNENLDIINNNNNIFKEINLDLNEKDILCKKIDELYSDIINSLIINGNIENYDFSYNIINQLDLENILITETMFNSLHTILDKDSDKYIIKNKEDLLDIKNINFYYILLKFIFKNSAYIYQIPLLLELKKLILKLIKSKDILYNGLKEENKIKLEYIFKTLADSEYYFFDNNINKYINQLTEILNYYKDFRFTSKYEDINFLQDIIKNKRIGFEKFLSEHKLAEKINLRAPIIKYLIYSKSPEDAKNEDKIQEYIKSWDTYEDMIKKNTFKKKMRKDTKQLLVKYFNEKKNQNVLLKIFKQEEIDLFIKTNSKQDKNNKKENNNKTNIINTNQIEGNNNNENNITTKINTNIIEGNNNNNIKEENNINNKNISTKYYSLKGDKNLNNEKKENEAKDLAPAVIKENNIKINKDIICKLFEKCVIYFHTNEKEKEPYIIYDRITIGEKNIEITYDKLISSKGNYEYYKKKEKNELGENFIKFIYFLKEVENRIREEYIQKYKLEIILEFNKENGNYNTDPSIYNITCSYTFIEPIGRKKQKYKDENIFINGTNSNLQGFTYLLNDINNNEIYLDLGYLNNIQNNNESKSNKEKSKKSEEKKLDSTKVVINDDSTATQSYIIDSQKKKKAGPFKIIEFLNIIGKHKNAADFIVELKNGFFISGGCENILILYDAYFIEKIKIRENSDWVFKVGEKMNSKEKEDIIRLLCTTNQEFDIIELYIKTLKTSKNPYQLAKKTNINFVEMKENNIVLLGRGGASYYIDLFNSKKQLTENKITEKTYRGLIKINDKNVSLTSNKIIPDGEDMLLLYNTKKKTEPYKINNYSFIICVNNLVIMPREETKINYKILICACKKYAKDQKNGILLVNPQLGDNKNIENPFYEIENFEVYCFCPILIVENKNSNFENIDEEYRKNITIKDTDYFFVGGFDLDKREGLIKLYKIVYGSKAWETKIEFIQDIIIQENENEKFEDFDGAITCIIQSKISGYILVTCYNGNVYLFTPPNMDLFTKKENT